MVEQLAGTAFVPFSRYRFPPMETPRRLEGGLASHTALSRQNRPRGDQLALLLVALLAVAATFSARAGVTGMA